MAIPLTGIELGNAMNGVSPSLNAFNTGIVRERVAIDARLALVATRYAASKAVQKSALRSGLIPIIIRMSAARIVTLPGMETGQNLAGMAPLEAARYQILMLPLRPAAGGPGALAIVAVAGWRAPEERDRVRLERLELR